MKTLLTTMLLFAASSVFGETLLVCEGETLTWWENGEPRSAELEDEVTVVIDGDTVEVDGRHALFSNRDGTIWVWTFDVGEQKWLFNLNTVSAKLTQYTTKKGTTGPMISVIDRRCRRVEERLIE